VRPLMAFLCAPLWVPLIVVLVASGMPTPSGPSASGLLIFAVISAFFAYLGMVVIGIPAYLFLRWRRWTTLWPAAAVGFVGGIVMSIVFGVVFFSVWGGWAKALDVVLGAPPSDQLFSLGLALVGALVAATAWLIIRPDRERAEE
jgi:hypothetical protein